MEKTGIFHNFMKTLCQIANLVLTEEKNFKKTGSFTLDQINQLKNSSYETLNKYLELMSIFPSEKPRESELIEEKPEIVNDYLRK